VINVQVFDQLLSPREAMFQIQFQDAGWFIPPYRNMSWRCFRDVSRPIFGPFIPTANLELGRDVVNIQVSNQLRSPGEAVLQCHVIVDSERIHSRELLVSELRRPSNLRAASPFRFSPLTIRCSAFEIIIRSPDCRVIRTIS
jgi:hypothetical protein